MEKYKNLSGNSGVSLFEIRENSIFVFFNHGGLYLYTYKSAGYENIEEMKSLAKEGFGLNRFINDQVKYNFEMKIR